MVNQVVLLAGGKGTRMRELTETIPKPMVEIGNSPVLQHLIDIFENFNNFNYIIATGYKSEIIENKFSYKFQNVFGLTIIIITFLLSFKGITTLF